MKKKLLYLTSILLFSSASINAQKVWDFSTWADNATGYSVDTTVDQLGFFPGTGTALIGVVEANSFTFSDGYPATKRLKINGNTTLTAGAPSLRYLYFTPGGSGNVKIWFRSGSNTAARTVSVYDGATVLGSAASNPVAGSAEGVILDVPFTNVTGKLTIGNDAACYIYKIVVTGNNTLGTNIFSEESDVAVYANDGAINVSNVTSATKVSVYSVLGSLVKSIETSADASLEINAGVYIVKAQSAEGTKTTKVIVK